MHLLKHARRSVTRTLAIAAILTVSLLPASRLTAQQPDREIPPRFATASIKPGDPQEESCSSTVEGQAGGHWRLVNMPLKEWLKMAFSIPDHALRAPAWLDEARFDLDATFPADKQPDQTAAAAMMKALLVQRFGLEWHAEAQSVPGYQLVSDKKVPLNAPGLEPPQGGRASSSGPGSLTGTNMSVPELAEQLGSVLGKPVLDATHLVGRYKITLTWTVADAAEPDEQKQKGTEADHLPSSLPEAVRQQLGMRLQNSQIQSRVIVVDHMDNQPSPD